MASAQKTTRSSSKISEKHRSAMNQLKKELGPSTEQAQATTKASILNYGVGTLKFQEKIDWSGTVVGSYPPSIPKNRVVGIVHQGTPPGAKSGSKGAVLYVGPNVQDGDNVCAWILAWSTLADGSPNKIYVETGNVSEYPKKQVNWDAIKAKLDDSTDESYNYNDGTGSEASASIDQFGNNPAATSVFDVPDAPAV